MKYSRTIALILASAMILTGCSKTYAPTDSELLNLSNSNGNINNLGSICADDECIYYQKTDDNFNLYKSDLNGNNESEINDAETYFINIYNDKIYYADAADGFSIYSANKDGSDKKRIIEAPAYYVNVYKDKIYYVDFDNNHKIYSADLDGSNITEIVSDSAYYVTVYSDVIYYVNLSDDANIYSINTDGTERKCIVDDYCGYINLYNDCIYYTLPLNEQTKKGDDSIYRYSLLDGTSELILNTRATDLNVYNDRIYYRDMDKKEICSCNMDGEDIKTEASDDGIYINIANDKMLYVVKNKDGKAELKSKEI